MSIMIIKCKAYIVSTDFSLHDTEFRTQSLYTEFWS